MSAQVYGSMPQAPRRHPLASTINNQAINTKPFPQTAIPGTPPKPQQQPAVNPAEPPLRRQNAKVAAPSPPRVIVDKSRSLQLTRLKLLGEGGFARVYEVRDRHGVHCAVKVVTNPSLQTVKAKTKLYAEIKIHRSLTHPNIVQFQECFDDSENVYMTLELCQNGSLMDILRRRKQFTEPEARFFMVQLVGACHYMHNHQVIHRDLKLGNIMLDSKMNIKVGDFGLAALIENPGERKKTMCGTPNYIAPEVLFDTANGHSFEVDTWSIGVILYTLLIGTPPFSTKNVNAIYRRIRENDYEFPPNRIVSREVQDLIQQILAHKPEERPPLPDIVDHVWFTKGIIPSYIPVSAQDSPPDFRHITLAMSKVNLASLRKQALLDEDPTAAVPPSTPTANSKTRSASLAQQEKEFQKVIQPGSPVSALLTSARQPLLVGPIASRGEQPLIRKLQAGKDPRSPARQLRDARVGALHGIEEEFEDAGTKAERLRKKQLESQKARIVAQMVPSTAPSPTFPDDDAENVPETKTKKAQGRSLKAESALSSMVPSSSSGQTLKVNGFDAAAQTLTAAFEAKSAGKLFRDPEDDVDLPDPKVFIVSWVDYCNKYGMGYALTDGSVGVHFNDSTTLVLSADKIHFDYISSRRQGSVYVRKNYTVSEYPEDLKSKVYLLKHFERYIMDRLYGDYDYTYEDHDRTKGMDFVQKYLRMKHVIVFKMSHDVLQFNFYDHSKVILSSQGLLVTHIDKNYQLTRFSLSEIIAASLQPSSNPEQHKRNDRMIEKLRYCKEVLISIRNAGGQSQVSPTDSDSPQLPSATSAPSGLRSRPSRMALR
ncbi:kinase-like domain-containing protein [Irpex rosettiformis]|uniref:Kinase-like domain-containing protein n=1 Tax=Irpex rosettiformis TaxID=378272 RepID=A0ACB8U841_9APHY|nr:kinase-like domain-containing protein [Irpex rosettiformis]